MLIDFDKIDCKKVTILCRHPEGVQVLVDFLKSKQFEVFFEKAPGAFFQSIANQKPGIAMISHEMNQLMGKVFPNFIHKKFKIPVLLFHELGGRKENFTASTSDNVNVVKGSDSLAIRSITQSSAEKIHEELEKIKSSYNESLGQLAKSTKQVSLEQLRKSRHERQNRMVAKLSSKIRPGLPVNDNKSKMNLLSVKVVDPSGHGSFLFFTELAEGKDMLKFSQELMADLQLPDDESLVADVMDGDVSQEIYQRLKGNSDKVIQGFWGQQALSVLYYSDSDQSNLEQITVTEDGFLVPVDNWWSKVPLTFNAHIWLELNERKLLYIHRGNSFLERNIPNFINKNQKILIQSEEFHAFQQLSELVALAKI